MLAPLAIASLLGSLAAEREGDDGDLVGRFNLVRVLEGPVQAWAMFFREQGRDSLVSVEMMRLLAMAVVRSRSLEELKLNLEEIWFCRRGFSLSVEKHFSGTFSPWISHFVSPIVDGRLVRTEKRRDGQEDSAEVLMEANRWPLGVPWFVPLEDVTVKVFRQIRARARKQGVTGAPEGGWFLTPYRFCDEKTGVANEVFYTCQDLVFFDEVLSCALSGTVWSGDKDRLLILVWDLNRSSSDMTLDAGFRIVPLDKVIRIPKNAEHP